MNHTVPVYYTANGVIDNSNLHSQVYSALPLSLPACQNNLKNIFTSEEMTELYVPPPQQLSFLSLAKNLTLLHIRLHLKTRANNYVNIVQIRHT
jgi:RecB family exonuclease